MRDGICLSATLYLPSQTSEQLPGIVMMTPYIGQSYHDRGIYFAAKGYLFLIVDVRGRGNSEGRFEPFRNEAEDGVDTLAWLARQDRCSGRLSMWGGSYSGYTQWMTASKQPSSLTSIAPVASPYLGVDFPIKCNIATPYAVQWLTLVWGRASQELIFSNANYWAERFRNWHKVGSAFKSLAAQVGHSTDTFEEWVSHPQQGYYWDHLNPSEHEYAHLRLPILTITGVYDGDQLGALMHYRRHVESAGTVGRDRHYLVIGPWDHAGTRNPTRNFCGLSIDAAGILDLNALHADWYDWTLREGNRPSFLKKNVAYYVMGAERWRYADSLDAITQYHLPLYLDSRINATDIFCSGSLDEEVTLSGEADHYTYDPRDVDLADLESTVHPESRTDDRMVYAARGRQLVYQTAPFVESREVSGFFRLTAWIAIDQLDTDFRAAIYDVNPDGSSVQLAVDYIRARYRVSLREESLIDTKNPLRYEFERFPFVARCIPKGNRLRLVFGPVNSIYSQKNYNSGKPVAEETVNDANSVRVRLYHDQSHRSTLYVPIGQVEA